MLPPDSASKRCNTLYLAGKACEKEYEQIARTPFVFRQVKPALWKAPIGASSFLCQAEISFTSRSGIPFCILSCPAVLRGISF